MVLILYAVLLSIRLCLPGWSHPDPSVHWGDTSGIYPPGSTASTPLVIHHPEVGDVQYQLSIPAGTTARLGDAQDGFQTVFTPDVSGTSIYLDWLERRCTKTLYVADFTFTSEPIVDAYCKLAKSGVDVHVILDSLEARAVKKEAPLISRLRHAGCEVVITDSPKHKIMHDKFSIADGKWVESGSWNYTIPADSQCNVLEFNVQPSPARARLFRKAWDDIYTYAMSRK